MYIETLKNVIAQAPRLVERDTVIGRNIADLQIAASGRWREYPYFLAREQ